MSRKRVWSVVAAGGVAAVVIPLLPSTASLLTYVAVAVLATSAAAFGVHRHRPVDRRTWLLVVGGLVSWTVGELLYVALDGLSGGPPFPSAADVFYLGGSATMTLGVLDLARSRDPAGPRAAAVDMVIMSIAGGALAWLLVLDPVVSSLPDSISTRVVVAGAPLLGVVLLAALAVLVLGCRSRPPMHLQLLTAGTIVMATSDLLYSSSAVTATYRTGDLADHGWLLTYVLFAAAALHPDLASRHEATGASPSRLPRPRLAVLIAAALATPLCIPITLMLLDDTDPRLRGNVIVLSVAAVITTALLLWRTATTSEAMARALHAADAATARARLITSVSTSLARATSVEDIRRAVAELAKLFPDPPVTVRLVRDDDPPATGGDTSRRGLRIPLQDDDREMGAIHLCGVTALPDEVTGAVETVAREAAMALDRWRLTTELRRNEQRFRSLVQHAPDAITVQGADGTITYASPAMGRIVGVDAEGLIGTRFADLIHPEDIAAGRLFDPSDLDSVAPETMERRVQRRDGTYRWVESRLTDRRDDPSVAGIVTNHRDITERRRLEAQLQHQADHDALTGLPNRRRFGAAVDAAIAAGERPTLLYLDLDRFKEVNDRFGHRTGDELLQRAASRISRCLRPSDVAARLGGDEFAVLLHGADLDQASVIADRLLAALRHPFTLEDAEVNVAASIGITSLDDEHLDAGSALVRADLAMYEAKRAGRDRALHYQEQHHVRAMRSLELEAGLRTAILTDGLDVHYQPILSVHTGECIGAEALLRWQHPELGRIGPDEFVPVAERAGLIGAIGQRVLERACAQAVAWSRPGEAFAMSVNVSAHQLAVPSFADDVARTLEATCHPAAALTLELTESTLLEDDEITRGTLAALRHLGVRLAIDDFGTGYATLRSLEDVPTDILKIDRSFVRNVTGTVEDSAIVRAVLQLAGSFDLETVAEGVETPEQLQILRELGCDRAQGYCFAPALPPEELVPWRRYTDEAGAVLDQPAVSV